MHTLFVDRKDSVIEIDRGRLVIRTAGIRNHFSVPTGSVSFLVISAPVKFSSTLMTRLGESGVNTVFVNPRRSEASSFSIGALHNDATRRLLQYRAVSSNEFCLRYARAIMSEKIRLQVLVLKKALRMRPQERYKLTQAISRIEGITHLLKTANITSLRGIEGAAAAFYFEGYQQLFAESLNFSSRNRRPPRDPVNVILSLTFTLLHAEAVRSLVSTGFDPFLGVYHKPAFGRESLACDLVETFRPLGEFWTWRLFADGKLRADHFSEGKYSADQPCILGKAGRGIYYAQYEKEAKAWRRMMRRNTRHWMQKLQKDLSSPDGKLENLEGRVEIFDVNTNLSCY